MDHKAPPAAKTHTPVGAPDDRANGNVKLVHAVGMHARPAVKLSKLAKQFRSRIALRVKGSADWVDAKSVAKVMAMRAPYDSTIELVAIGADARAAIGALTALIASDFLDFAG